MREAHDVEIVDVFDERVADFLRANEREALRSLYGFPVVWHEQMHGVAALRGGEVVGAATVRIAASLASLLALTVAPPSRRTGVGRRLLHRIEELASYYNCHKVTLEVPVASETLQFFERCGYKTEAVLPQHTFKLDVAVLRKFLL